MSGEEINGSKSFVGISGNEKNKVKNEAFVDAIRAKYSDKIHNVEATAVSDTFIMTGKKRERENPDIGNMTNAKNEAYENIEHKKFIYCNEQTAHELSEKAESMGIKNLWTHYNGDKSFLQVDGVKDINFIRIAESNYDVWGSMSACVEYNKMENKEFLYCNAQTAFDISQKALEQGINAVPKFSGNESSFVVVDGVKNAAFIAAIKAEFNVRTGDKPIYPNKAEYSGNLDDMKATADRITSIMDEHKQERENPEIGTER